MKVNVQNECKPDELTVENLKPGDLFQYKAGTSYGGRRVSRKYWSSEIFMVLSVAPSVVNREVHRHMSRTVLRTNRYNTGISLADRQAQREARLYQNISSKLKNLVGEYPVVCLTSNSIMPRGYFEDKPIRKLHICQEMDLAPEK